MMVSPTVASRAPTRPESGGAGSCSQPVGPPAEAGADVGDAEGVPGSSGNAPGPVSPPHALAATTSVPEITRQLTVLRMVPSLPRRTGAGNLRFASSRDHWGRRPRQQRERGALDHGARQGTEPSGA